MYRFKTQYTFEKRREVSQKLFEKYPDRIPVIVEPGKECRYEINKSKFITPRDISMGRLISEIRKYVTIGSEEGLFLFINDEIPPTSQLIEEIYNKHHDSDGFLYITCHSENTFG